MIESLQSPHIGRVKALLSSKKDRYETGEFVAEGLQPVREAIQYGVVKILYLTGAGRERLIENNIKFEDLNTVEVSEAVAKAMSDATSPQGIIAICAIPASDKSLLKSGHIIYLYEIQDPGNAGTILRTADAMGISAVVTSPGSVDFYSPKVVRSTAGSLWHIPLYSGVELAELRKNLPTHKVYLLDGNGDKSLFDVDFKEPAIWIFGNEARGLQEGFTGKVAGATRISISMPGKAESLNLAAAAAIVMHEISRGR